MENYKNNQLRLNPYYVTGICDGEVKNTLNFLSYQYMENSKYNRFKSLLCNSNWISNTSFTKARSSAGIRYFSTKQSCSNSLSLVVWGTNLPSLVGKGRLTKQESNMIKTKKIIFLSSALSIFGNYRITFIRWLINYPCSN